MARHARDGDARAGELCERHADSLTPPQGWRLDDRRGVAGTRPAAGPAGTRATTAPAVAQLGLDEHCPAPHEVPPPALELLLRARTPLLARAFQSAGNP